MLTDVRLCPGLEVLTNIIALAVWSGGVGVLKVDVQQHIIGALCRGGQKHRGVGHWWTRIRPTVQNVLPTSGVISHTHGLSVPSHSHAHLLVAGPRLLAT